MPREINQESLNLMASILMTAKTKEECQSLLYDILTRQELQAVSQRITVAKMLFEKKVYVDIVQATGASTATISRVNRSLHEGAGGYAGALKKLNAVNTQDVQL
jgi:TrpR-related protein YerC/YecD